MKSVIYTIKLAGKIYRGSKRWVSGQPMDGVRRTDATFWTPASRSLDPSGRALRWEMQRGAARAAWRMGATYLLLLGVLLLLLWGAGALFSLPGYLRPGSILLLHLCSAGVILLVYVTHKGNVEHGYSLPYLVRTEQLSSTGEETEEELLQIEGGEKVLHSWEVRWHKQEGRLEWEREKVLPLAQSLSTTLNVGHMTPAKARRMVNVPRNFRTSSSGMVAEILLPPTFIPGVGVQKQVATTVRARLGIREELSSSWQMEGSAPRVVFSLPELPPEKVRFSHVEKFLLAAEEYSPFLGIIGGGEALSISLKDDSPHIAVSAGSGAGKSELIKAIVMHFSHWGWNTVILDWKEESHAYADGARGVRYCKSVEQIHDMAVAMGDEVETRKANPHLPRPKICLVTEEMNITAPLLAEYWSSLRAQAEPEERRHMPLRSPAITALMKVNYTGRQLGMCQIFVAQKFSARTTNGNADARESFQVIMMSRFKPQTVAMLGNGIKPFPKSPTAPGRWIAVIGQETATFQAALITDEEARTYMESGIEPAYSPFVMATGAARGNGPDVDHTLGDQLPHGATRGNGLPVIEGEEVVLRKLRDIADSLGHLGVTLKVLQKAALAPASGGDETFPPALGGTPTKGYTYDVQAVKEWAKRRNAARAAEKVARG